MKPDDRLELGYATLDLGRQARTGIGETVYGPGKTPEQLAAILRSFAERGVPVLATKCTPEQFAFLQRQNVAAVYDPVSRLVKATWGEVTPLPGRVAVCTGGTADVPVAEEAAGTAEFFGLKAERHYDVGVAGLHRLLARIDAIREADVVIAVAGMEGALGSVVAGLVAAPVIAVPTSVGYGAAFQGVSALLAMLNSCAEGMSVVNIDNGFGAAVQALRIVNAAKKLS